MWLRRGLDFLQISSFRFRHSSLFVLWEALMQIMQKCLDILRHSS